MKREKVRNPKGANRSWGKNATPKAIMKRIREPSTRTGSGRTPKDRRWLRPEEPQETTIRDNSAQREDPVAKEPRFDRVMKKVNQNHTRPKPKEDKKKSPRRKITRHPRKETRIRGKVRSTRVEEQIQVNRRQESREPKGRYERRQKPSKENNTKGGTGERKRRPRRGEDRSDTLPRRPHKENKVTDTQFQTSEPRKRR